MRFSEVVSLRVVVIRLMAQGPLQSELFLWKKKQEELMRAKSNYDN
jgi:hypothetical protein